MPSSLLCALAAAALADAAAPRRPAGREPPHRPLRIVTYNVHAWRCSGHRDNYERVEAVLRELDPDVLCLNEVLHPFLAPPPDHPYWIASADHEARGYAPPAGTLSEADASLGRTHLHRLARTLGLDHVAFAPATTCGSFFGDYPFGNAICSRYPLDQVCHTLLRVETADLALGRQSRTPEDLEDRLVTTARVRLGGAALGVALTHLDHRSETLRQKQARMVVGAARAAFGAGGADGGVDEPADGSSERVDGVSGVWEVPVVVCGDLNSFDASDLDAAGRDAVRDFYSGRGWPPPREASLVLEVLRAAGLEDAFALCDRTARDGAHPLPTCWTHRPLFRIDWVALGDGRHHAIKARSYRTVVCDASDHRPVLVEVELVPRAST